MSSLFFQIYFSVLQEHFQVFICKSFTSLNRFILGILFLLVLWIVFSSITSPNWLFFAHMKKHWFLYIVCVHAKLFQSDMALWDPMDHSPPGFSVHGILQERILEWMHETSAQAWCTGKTQRNRVEREVGGGIGMGNTCKSMADSCQYMTKTTTIL